MRDPFDEMTDGGPAHNGWPEWKRAVLGELKRHDIAIEKLTAELISTRIDQAKAMIKISMMSAAMAAIGTSVVTVFLTQIVGK